MIVIRNGVWYKCQAIASNDTGGKICIFHGIAWYELVPMSKAELKEALEKFAANG